MAYRISENYIVREIVDECVIIPVKSTGENDTGFIALNETGRIIIKGIEKGLDVDAIAAAICEEYNADKESVKKDIAKFIEEFTRNGILKAE